MSAALHAPAEAPPTGLGEPTPAPSRAAALLDVLMGLSVLAGLAHALLMTGDPRVPAAQTTAYLVVVIAMAALWVLLRLDQRRARRLGRPVAVALAVAAAAGLFLADGPGAWPLFLVATMALVSTFSARAGAVLVAAVLAAQAVAFLASARGLAETASQVLGSAWIFGFALVLAWLVAEHAAQRERITALLAETRRGAAAEVELVLADERTRSARDLHDGLGHRLTVITMALRFAERSRERDPERAWEQVASARAQAGEALTTMRRWVRALSPVRVEGADVADALEAIAESFRGTGLEVRVDAPAEPLEDRAVTLYLHRFVQEGLTNALRHSAARRVDVGCRVLAGAVVLSVADDGSPGSAGRPGPAHGFGLRSLGEGAGDLGGGVSTAWSGSGFALTARLPRARGGRAP